MEKSQKENAGKKGVIVDEKTGKILPKIVFGRQPQDKRQLTQKEEMLAQALVAGHSKEKAGHIAGYNASSKDSMATMVNRALNRERVKLRIEEIRAQAIERCQRILNVFGDIAEDPAAEAKDRIKAGEAYMDQVSFSQSLEDNKSPSSINVNALFASLQG